ncbi:solute carrier organic anion transporter family member 3A1-like [Callorhinchus milii]|uniref:solute carrier organic anion transporter family member 3A1-like n=1 Tax=Callorhinchus milii TaxID=7868 RepID=UPI001C3FE320|nr:solute carrier organic anion transporter family member 3A1-like [Callorhinchus milii]
MLIQGISGAYLVSILTTLERRFDLQSTELGVIASSFEIGNLMIILLVSYFGGKGHRPRLIGCGGIIMAIGSLFCALPEFLSHQYQYKKVDTSVLKDTCSANLSLEEVQMSIEKNLKSCAETETTNMMYVLVIVAQVIIGAGATPIQPLGVSYIDDHVRKRDSSLYIGVLFTTMLFGPAFGFMLGSLFTTIYVDAIFIDVTKLDITQDDPRWIGAWWAGFLLCAGLLFFSSLFMFGFPQAMPKRQHTLSKSVQQPMLPNKSQKEQPKPAPDDKTKKECKQTSEATCTQYLRGIPQVTKQLLTNPVFTCVVLSACMEVAAISGFAAFLGKYLERQFGLSASYANQFIGVTAVPCVCLGIFLGGFVLKKMSLTPLGAIKMTMTVNLLSTTTYVLLLFLGCDTGPVAGATIGYMNGSFDGLKRNLTVQCNEDCGCTKNTFNPVCGSDGITYLSPCFAGCTDKTLSNCACISTEFGQNATAVAGRCPRTNCELTFPAFFAVVCVGSLIGAMAQTPSVMILIRSVNPENKSYALGVQFLMLRLLGFIPPPLIFGAAIDSTCLVWSETCNKSGACAVYDNDSYRYLYATTSKHLCE